MNVVVIEDELVAAQELCKLLVNLRPDWAVVATLQSIDETVDWLQKHPQPGLIFSDIQLADGLSFQIFSTIPVSCPIIFCTAFDQYAIRAFETNGIDYLLKPIELNRLAIAIKKYENLTANTHTLPTFQRLLEQLNRPSPSYQTSLLVYHRDAIIPLNVTDVMFIHYDTGVVSVTTKANQRYVLSQTLDELENILSPQVFFRANRQFIIHRQSIQKGERYFGRRLNVKLVVPIPEPIIISKARVSEFLHWLQQ